MDARQPRWRPWVITGLLFFFMFINFADKVVIGLAAVPMMQEMQLSPIQWGMVGSSFFYFFSIACVLVGFLVNRVPAKWALAVMALIWALTQFPMLGAVSLGVLIASRVVLGAGEGPAYPVALHAAYKWFPNHRRTLPTAIISIGAGIGVTISAPILVYVIYAYSWHAAFGLLGVVGLVWVAAWLLLGEEGTIAEPVVASGDADEDRVPYLQLLTCRTALGVFIAGFAVNWGLALLVAWVPPFMQQGLGYSVEATKWLVTLTWLATATVAPIVAWLSQRWVARGASSRLARGVPAALFPMSAGIITMIAVPLHPGPLQIALFVVANSIGGLIYTLGPPIMAEITPVRQRGGILGLTTAIHSTAGLIAPALTGYIIAAGPTLHDGYVHAFMLMGGIVAAGGFIALLLIRPEADIARFAARSWAPARRAAAE
ncbi:MAG TPA: MFS transporter [Stellaceae bacterium]